MSVKFEKCVTVYKQACIFSALYACWGWNSPLSNILVYSTNGGNKCIKSNLQEFKRQQMRACYDSLCGTKDSSLSYDVLLNKRL